MLVIQVVEILWTKATRGAPRSNERVSLPRAFSVVPAPEECFVQRHRIAEWEGFGPKLIESSKALPLPGVVGVMHIAKDPSGSFLVGTLGTPHSGQPKRRPIEEALKISPGEYVRFIVNARHTNYSGQYYSETIYNIACGDVVPANRFLTGKPDHELDLKAHLF